MKVTLSFKTVDVCVFLIVLGASMLFTDLPPVAGFAVGLSRVVVGRQDFSVYTQKN